VIQRLLLNITPWKRRQQRRVNIQDQIRIGLKHHRAEDPHKTRENHQSHVSRFQGT